MKKNHYPDPPDHLFGHVRNDQIQPLDGTQHVYHVYDPRGRKLLAQVRAAELSEVAEKTEHLWPCRVRAPHLPYDHVDIEETGTLSFLAG